MRVQVSYLPIVQTRHLNTPSSVRRAAQNAGCSSWGTGEAAISKFESKAWKTPPRAGAPWASTKASPNSCRGAAPHRIHQVCHLPPYI